MRRIKGLLGKLVEVGGAQDKNACRLAAELRLHAGKVDHGRCAGPLEHRRAWEGLGLLGGLQGENGAAGEEGGGESDGQNWFHDFPPGV
jgi:hypothetical protein